MNPPRLPINVPPARHELLVSYLARLATLHGLDYDELWQQISVSPRPGGNRREPVADRLSHLTGRSPEHLAAALPELRDPAPDWRIFRHEPQLGCPACAARHPGGPVTLLLPHHRYVCTRHRYWIGPPDCAWPSPRLDTLPDVVAAQRRHLRLMHRRGWAAAYDAVLTGFMICGWVWDRQHYVAGFFDQGIWQRWADRADILIPPGTAMTTFSASKIFAATYPEAVAIASLIGSPPWRALAAGSIAEQRRFADEISSRLCWHGYQPQATSDAIAHWMESDAPRPPSAPPKTFPQTRGNKAPGQLTSVSERIQGARSRSANWYGRNQKGGNVILHHRHIRPVLIREWSREMQHFVGAIWASQTTNLAALPDFLKTRHGDDYLPTP